MDEQVIAICGFICGVDNWVELEEFGEVKRESFAGFLELRKGIPSHDTFGRLFGTRVGPLGRHLALTRMG